LVTLIVLLLAGAGVSYWAFKGTPDFYRRPAHSQAEWADAARRAEDKIIHTKEWANDVWVNEQRAINARDVGTSQPSSTSSRSYTASFTEQELNAFFDKWSMTYRWDEKYARYIKDPTIALRDGRIILAGTVPDVGTVASFHFAPAIDDKGQFRLNVARVLAGRLPMPDMVWSAQRERLENAVRSRLPEWQKKAEIAPNGVANADAIAADASKLLLEMLNNRPRRPVLLLPFGEKAVPVRLTDVKVADGTLSFTVIPVTPAERAALLERVREPEPGATASAQ
jgi:hypothetical protein